MGVGQAWNKLTVLSLSPCLTTTHSPLVTTEAEEPVTHGGFALVSTPAGATTSLGTQGRMTQGRGDNVMYELERCMAPVSGDLKSLERSGVEWLEQRAWEYKSSPKSETVWFQGAWNGIWGLLLLGQQTGWFRGMGNELWCLSPLGGTLSGPHSHVPGTEC